MRRETSGFPNYIISVMLPLVPLCEVQIFHPVIFILNLADGHEVGNYVNTALFRKNVIGNVSWHELTQP
jgi:hypothetical protein